jgi:hypothetical protein
MLQTLLAGHTLKPAVPILQILRYDPMTNEIIKSNERYNQRLSGDILPIRGLAQFARVPVWRGKRLASTLSERFDVIRLRRRLLP